MFNDNSDLAEDEIVNESIKTTDWYNPTEDTITLILNVETPTNRRKVREGSTDKPLSYFEKTGNRKIVIKSKQTVTILSEFDNAIQTVREGFIIKGLAPQLVNKGAKVTPKIHPSLDGITAERNAAQAEAVIAVKAQAAAAVRITELTEELARMKAASNTVEQRTASATAEFVPPPKKP